MKFMSKFKLKTCVFFCHCNMSLESTECMLLGTPVFSKEGDLPRPNFCL